MTEPTTTSTAPISTPGTAPTSTTTNGQPPAPNPPAAQSAGKQPPWGEKPENFDADKAWELIQNLRTEKADPQLRSELDALKQQQTAQRDALASALGVKPEETSDADKLAKQIETLRGQITASERRALAVEFKVPEDMLTAKDAAGMRQQAESLVAFAQAAHYAAATSTPAPPAPAFQQNPGQGQGNTPLTPEAAAAAEYEKYYDPATGRPRFSG
jgi:hypothetical protein